MVLSTEPGATGPPITAEAASRRTIVDAVDGGAIIAAYTVHHDHDDATDAVLICDVGNPHSGTRAYARATDPAFLAALEAQEWVGRPVTLRHVKGVNVAGPA